MSWSIGYDSTWKRDIGYGVPAHCDHPDCNEEIDRGLGYVCGGEPYGGDWGCGLYFCSMHQKGVPGFCERCATHQTPFKAKADHPIWINHKMTHESWKEWREKHQTNPSSTPSETGDFHSKGFMNAQKKDESYE